MISKNQIKFINSLKLKKNRDRYQLFVVEGKKSVSELLNSNFEIDNLYATDDWVDEFKGVNVVRINDSILNRISNQKNPDQVLALVKIKRNQISSGDGVVLVLESVNDPGNLGTILRTCDWFGVKNVVCSHDTVDIYNPKVVQSSMGSIFRLNVSYTDLTSYLATVSNPIFGAFISGDNVKDIDFPEEFHLIVGNEANGISKAVKNFITHQLTIKRVSSQKVESLNVATATSILLYQIRS